MTPARTVLFLAAALLTVTQPTRTTAQAPAPVTINNCGVPAIADRPPARVVTMNQAATEIMLTLGLEDRLVGTAYLDDEILPELAERYKKIPVLAAKYPAREVLLQARPDFIYAAYSSAFAPAAAGARAEWSALGVKTYLAPAACVDKSQAPGVTLDTLFTELAEVGRMFGVQARADALIAGYRKELAALRERIGPVTKPLRVFWYDSGDPPEVGACCGVPNEILRVLGAVNIFADTRGSWTVVNWEAVVAKNPEVIVLANSTWSTAESVGSSRVDLQACKLEYSIVSPK